MGKISHFLFSSKTWDHAMSTTLAVKITLRIKEYDKNTGCHTQIVFTLVDMQQIEATDVFSLYSLQYECKTRHKSAASAGYPIWVSHLAPLNSVKYQSIEHKCTKKKGHSIDHTKSRSNQMFIRTSRNITKKANRLFHVSVLGSWLIDKNALSLTVH